jgi:hypothetical protein
MFLIPVAIVGYNIWEKMKREEEERIRSREEPSDGGPFAEKSDEQMGDRPALTVCTSNVSEGSTSALDAPSSGQDEQQDLFLIVEDDGEVHEELELDTDPGFSSATAIDLHSASSDSSPTKKCHNPIESIVRFFTQEDDDFRIKSNQHALTYEVLGNRGSSKYKKRVLLLPLTDI